MATLGAERHRCLTAAGQTRSCPAAWNTRDPQPLHRCRSAFSPPLVAAVAAMAVLAVFPSVAHATRCRPLTEKLYFACGDGRCSPLFRISQHTTFYCRRRHVVDSVPPAVAETLEPALRAFAGSARLDVVVRLIRDRTLGGTMAYSGADLARPDVSELPDSGAGSAEAERIRYAALAASELRSWQRRRALEIVMVPLVIGLLAWSCLVFDGRVARRLGGWRYAAAGATQIGLATYGAGSVNVPNLPLSVRIAQLVLLVMIFELAIAAWRSVSGPARR